jgi:Tfp pilus assembly protein PilO
MARWSRKQLTVIAIAVVLVAVFFGGIFIPLKRQLWSLKDEQRRCAVELSQASADASKVPALSDQLVSLKAKVGDFPARVPTSRQLGEFLQSVAKIMNEQNLQNQLVQPGEPVKAKGIHCIPVDIQCEGTLKQIFALMRSLEDIRRQFRLEHLELTTDRAFAGKVGLHATVYIYYKGSSEAEI